MTAEIRTPKSLAPHAHKFAPDSWKEYSIEELMMWVKLLAKRAKHRTDPKKAQKDFADAANYRAMLRAKVEAEGNDMSLLERVAYEDLKVEEYDHHGRRVKVKSKYKGLHRDMCLCYGCQHFNEDDDKANCAMASELYAFTRQHGGTAVRTECSDYEAIKT